MLTNFFVRQVCEWHKQRYIITEIIHKGKKELGIVMTWKQVNDALDFYLKKG